MAFPSHLFHLKKKLTKKTLVAAIALPAIIGIYLVLTANGIVQEYWETTNGAFKVRIERRSEIFNFLPRYYYDFKSQSPGAIRWRKIVTTRTDDPKPLPRNQVRFVNDEIGYVFMVSTFAITTDAGNHWSVFDVRTDPPLGKHDSYLIITDVKVEANGMSTMMVYSKADQNEVELHSKDYGKHWNVD